MKSLVRNVGIAILLLGLLLLGEGVLTALNYT